MGCEYCENKKHIKQIDFNGNVYQNEQDLSESGFNYEKEQLYFEFEINNEKVLIGMRDILVCMKFAEEQGEIPKIGNYFWHQADSLYDCGIM